MTEEVIETPEISEDESLFDSSQFVVDTSLIDKDEVDDSFAPKVGKKKACLIESDTSSDEEEELKNISESSFNFFNGKGKTHIHNSTEITNTAVGNIKALEQSYRDTLPIISSRSPSPEHDDIVEISDDEKSTEIQEEQEYPTIIQDEAAGGLIVEPKYSDVNANNKKTTINNVPDSKIQVSNVDLQRQIEKVQSLNMAVQRTKNCIKTVPLNSLPDKGEAIVKKLEHLTKEAKDEESKLNRMMVTKEVQPRHISTWENIQAGLSNVQPRTFGKQALQTLNLQKALTMDRLEQLHGSLKNCPTPDTVVEDPKGLKVELMPHQKHAIAWLMWREKQKPSGGILADDMGLGKTLTMISLTLKINETEQENLSDDDDTNPDRKSSKYPGGTLVVCPASLIYQWESEIKKHVKKGLISAELYHGNNRETKAKRLARQNMVITTYALAMGDHAKSGPLFKIKWRRIILDEAHQVRNYKSQTSIAVCDLAAKSRWTLTGTPIHNKELDLYALLKFLRCSPFDDLTVWKRWVANKNTGGQDRLNTVMSSLILRRTKQQLEEKKMLTCLPQKTWNLIEITLDEQEMCIYQKVLIFSRTLFAQFLHQRAEKDSDQLLTQQVINNPNGEYYKMHQRLVKLNRVKKIKQHEILVLLLRLRQICCHPSLITGMLQEADNLGDSDSENQEELNLLEQLNKLNIDDENNSDSTDPAYGLSTETGTENQVGLAEASRNLLNPANPVFAEDRRSSKVKKVMEIVQETVSTGDKIVIISQWTKLLNLIAIQLKQDRILYFQLDGSVPVSKRMELVHNFNNPKHEVRVLLLSLTAGGVGLNLVGANHLILLDLHWNPQLEIQAQDRIYRVGQSKPVTIYKFLAVDTIEQRIKNLQEHKLRVAEEVLTGAKIQQQNKLSLEDLKMLFNM